MRCFCLILLLCATDLLLADDALPQHAEHSRIAAGQSSAADTVTQELIKQLASPSFEMRRSAFLRLWKDGHAARPELQAAQTKLAAAGSSAEGRQLAESLASLQLLVQLGISPDKPNDSLRLVELLSEINPRKLVQICELGHWDLATQMVRNNAALHESLSDAYGRYTLNQIVDIAYEDGDLSRAWPIIYASTSTAQIAWIAKKLSFELPVADGERPDERATRLFYSGDIEQALKIAIAPQLRVPMLTRSFRWSEFLNDEAQFAVAGARAGAAQSAARAVLTEIGGDLARSELLWNAILAPNTVDATAPGDHAPGVAALDPLNVRALEILRELSDPISGNADQSNQFLLALLMSGRAEPIEQFLTASNQPLAFTFLVDRNQFKAALELIGLQPDLGNLDSWLEQQRIALPQALKRGSRTEVEVATRTAAVLIGLGFQPQAVRILDMLGNLARDEPKFEVAIWIDTIARRLGRHESRALCLRLAEASYPLMSAECQERILESLHPELGSVAPQLFACAPNHLGMRSDSAWHKLEKLRLWDREYFGPQAETVISNWLRDAKQRLSREQLSAEHLSLLARIARDFGFDELALEILSTDIGELRGEEAINLHWLDAAEIYIQQLKPQQALRSLSALRKHGLNLQAAIVAEIEALIMAGEYDRAALLEQSRWMRPLAPERYYAADYADVVRHYIERHETDRALEYAEPAFLFSDSSSRFLYFAAMDYAGLTEEKEDFQKSADIQRATLVEALQPRSSLTQFMISNGYTSSLRFAVQKERLARAIACIEQQEFEAAERHLVVSYNLQPQDIEAVVQCYPRLMRAGQSAQAEAWFARYESEMKRQIDKWPSDSTALNNLAWMYSQCDRNLDEALTLAQRAVAVAPNSPVFLDTLAEVEFRCRKIEQALQTARDCVRLDPRDAHYRDNLVRFRNDDKERR